MSEAQIVSDSGSPDGTDEELDGAALLTEAIRSLDPGLVAMVPGRPLTETEEALAASGDGIWITHEAVAMQMALGATVDGATTVAMFKQVGFQVALDVVSSGAVHWVGAPCVVIVGDDPGCAGSDIEGDARVLAAAVELPCFEPAGPSDILDTVQLAAEASARIQAPTIVRITRQLAAAKAPARAQATTSASYPVAKLEPPATVWGKNPDDQRRLHNGRLAVLADDAACEHVAGDGAIRIVAVGQMAVNAVRSGADVLVVRRTFPTPDREIEEFLGLSDRTVLVLEDGMPVIERLCREYSDAPVLGRLSRHVPVVGPPDADAIIAAGETPSPAVIVEDGESFGLEDLQGMGRLFEFLKELEFGPVVCDAGMCGNAPYLMPDLAPLCFGLGSAPGTAAGLAAGSGRPTVAVTGDMAFFHVGFSGFLQVVRMQLPVLTVLHDNGVGAYTGGQPHVGSDPGPGEQAISPETLARGAGVEWVRRITRAEANTAVLRDALEEWRGRPCPALLVIDDRDSEAR